MGKGRKIVIVGSAWPLRGGLSAFNERLAREYLKEGDEVVIYTFSLQYPSILFPGKTQYSSSPAPSDLDIRVKVNTINPLTWFSAGKEIKKMNPDLVLIKFWIPFVAPSLGKIARIIRGNKKSKVISIIDNIIPHEKRPGDRVLAKYWVNSVDGFITMSRDVLNDLNTFDETKPKKYCPHPLYDHYGETVDKQEAKRSLGLDPETNYLLFFGFIRDYKGLDWLLKAIDREFFIKNKIKLLVAGEFYTDSQPYYDIIKENDLQDLVIMSNDFIPDEKVALYFNAADVVVQPYKDATQSGVTQIAYHFEKPIITTDVGGLAEIVPDGKVGYVVQPEIGEIAKAVRKFYEEDKEEEFRKGVKEIKKTYSWSNMLESIDEVVKMIN
jgi:glycosyltransferase involved in cell wall biosynthesis